ncbi:unnamed protein product [Didymodactylos carnosus]|uniref:Uncharacterized protein n=1 Tax=Didymodactylos carnosus TaxID=1234261 RepID=A0A813UJX4_9BILA|nr:unnamed protein product [Didymodactylos carnosus]CAF3611404.1 unnamed protein product [Didymodactylos carnosus]
MPFNSARCGLCEKDLRKEKKRHLKNTPDMFDYVNDLYLKLYGYNIDDETALCTACYMRHSRSVKSGASTDDSNIEMDTETRENETVTISSVGLQATSSSSDAKTTECSLLTEDTIKLPIAFPGFSKKYCLVCHQTLDDGTPSTKMSDEIRINTFIYHSVYFKDGSRSCLRHIEGDHLNEAAVKILQKYHSATAENTANGEHISLLIKELQSHLEQIKPQSLFKPRTILNFDAAFLYSDEDYGCLTGIDKEQFNSLTEIVRMRNTENRSIRMAIGCLLTKLRTGLSNQVLATLFAYSDRRVVGKINHSAYDALLRDFVPQYLGFHHITREEILKKHTTPLASALLTDGDGVVIILDETYIYTEKPGNNILQRRLFSLHKGRSLIKPMIIVASDGYIISSIGSYLADY